MAWRWSPAAGRSRGRASIAIARQRRRGAPARPCWPLRRHDADRAHQAGDRREPVHRRGLPQDLGAAALFRDPQLTRTHRRLMRENGLLAPHRVRKRPDKTHDGTIITDAVDVLWGTDMTQTITVAQGVAHVFVAVDHCNSECIGIHADKSANRFQALEPVRQGVRQHFAAIGKDVAAGLKLRHDHGSNYMSKDFQTEIAFLGIEASPSFVREPEGNGVAERFIRTLKENLLWVRHFETIEELRLALLDF